MPKARKPKPSARARAIALPWIGRRTGARLRADGRTASPKPTWRRVVGILAGSGVAVLVLGLGAWLAFLYMPLPASQVIPRVKAAIEERLGPDYVIAIEDAELQRTSQSVELRLVDLVISKAAGSEKLAVVPRAELALDGMGLLGGEVKVRRVHVTDPKLDIRFDTTVDAAAKNVDLPDRILAAIEDLDRLLGADGAAGALEEVDVSNATLLVSPRSRAPLSFDGVDLRLARGAGGAIALTAGSSSRESRWSSAVTVSATDPVKGRVIDLGIENIDLGPYSAPFAEKAGAPPVSGRVSGHLNARIGPDSRLAAGEGRIEARDLLFTMPTKTDPSKPADGPIGVERLQLALNWDPAKRAVMIAPSMIRGKGGQGGFTGSVSAPSDKTAPWLAEIEGRDVLLAGENVGDPPLRLDRVDVAASFDAAQGVLDVSKAQFLGPTARAAATATVRFEGESPAVKLGVASEPMPTSAVKRLWPYFLASSVRGWVIENVGAGTVDSLSLKIDVPSNVLHTLGPHDPLPDGSMFLDIGFSDGVLRGSAGMPWIEGAKGRVISTARKTDVSIEKAFISGGEAEGPLSVSDVLFTVPNLEPRYPKARLTLKADGSLRRALSMLGSGAFGANPVPAQIDVTKVSGRIASNVMVDLELAHEDGKSPPPVINASADMRDVRILGVFAGRNFEKGSLQLKVDDGPTTLSGKGRVGGAAATVLMTDAPGAPTKRKLNVVLTADATDLQRFGLDVPGSMKGALPLSVDLMLDEPKSPMNVSADLASVGMDGVVPGFKKPAGRPGKLGFVVEKSGDKTLIRDFVLESGDRSVRGTIEFGPKGELLSASLPIYRPGPGDDARVDIDKARGGSTKIAVQGAALDLKPLLDRVRGKPTSAGAAAAKADAGNVPKDLDVTAKLGTGLGYGGEAIAGLDLKLVVRGGKVTDADGTGRIGSGPISVATAENGRLAIAGGDAGSFFRFADLYGRIDGGAFTLAASLSGGPGVLKIQKFAVRNETALERARQATNADQGAPAEAQQRSSTRFDKLQVVFVQQSGSIRVSEATVYGPTIGATMEGVVNYAADRVDLVGTFVPVYALNNLVSRVPIIGQLLGGGKNGGLVGVTFQVKGGTASPTISVNPISAVAPGFFRKLFEFRQNSEGGGAEPATGSTTQQRGAASR